MFRVLKRQPPLSLTSGVTVVVNRAVFDVIFWLRKFWLIALVVVCDTALSGVRMLRFGVAAVPAHIVELTLFDPGTRKSQKSMLSETEKYLLISATTP